MPETKHDQYLNSMSTIWPEDKRLTNRLYTSETCIPIRECGRVRHNFLNIIIYIHLIT